jgi:glutamate-1-semialdehyde 2,1-aminomutase
LSDRTDDLTREADRLLGYGAQHRRLLRPFYEDNEGIFPRFAQSARGYELVDSEGRSFVDWVNGGGPVLLGYGHPTVEEAIRSQLGAGPTLSLMHPVELDVSSLLTEMVPSAERIAFGKNGSDAVTAAVRVARATTGKDVVLQHGVHGFHDWYVAVHGVPGVPPVLGELVHSFPYNDLDALSRS